MDFLQIFLFFLLNCGHSFVKGQSPLTYTYYYKNGHNLQLRSSCDLTQCGCISEWIPFCGSDLVTYDNKCQLKCAKERCDPNLNVKHEGVCYVHDSSFVSGRNKNKNANFKATATTHRPRPHTTRRTFIPTIRTTTSPPYFNEERVDSGRFNGGSCPSEYEYFYRNGKELQIRTNFDFERNCPCNSKWTPFCGSDKVTYSNKCQLLCFKSICNPSLNVKHEGNCYVHEEGFAKKFNDNFSGAQPEQFQNVNN